MFLYDAAMRLAMRLFRAVWENRYMRRFVLFKHKKAYRLITGQEGLLQDISSEMEGDNRDVLWFHAASYGEYNVIRPVISALRSDKISIVVTVFSSSGYRILKYQGCEADHVFYLPWDTQENAARYLDIIKPAKAIFAISEYWINYLNELRRRNIPTYTVSMLVGDDSYLLKWYSRPIRKALKAVTKFMVLDDRSKRNLGRIGFDNAVVIGDPLFDNAIRISKEPYQDNIIARFCDRHDVFIAGSISDDKDLRLVSELANANNDVRFIMVPHEISGGSLKDIVASVQGKARLYSDCTDATDFSDTQVLVIDFLGSLAKIYRYGKWAYVGGGFTPYLHSIIEPVAYGIPVAFGPRTGRKNTPKEMIRLGIGSIVRTEKELQRWFTRMNDEEELQRIRVKASQFIRDNSGFTKKVVKELS